MPSIRAVLMGLGLSTLTLLQISSATPMPKADKACPTLVSKPVSTTPTLPLSGGATELPSTTLTLVAVGLGRGIQNYTCSAPSAAPVAIGAIATLYDATTLADYSETVLHSIPPMAVYMPLPPTTAASKTPVFTLPPPIGPINVVGHHYFDAAGTPTFDLSPVGAILYCAKKNNVKAPATASKGPAGTGAVDWLFLSAKDGYTSVGASAVYRVVTAGGVSPNCTSAGQTISVQYAAEYWFYKGEGQ